jgi:hypothetical protein
VVGGIQHTIKTLNYNYSLLVVDNEQNNLAKLNYINFSWDMINITPYQQYGEHFVTFMFLDKKWKHQQKNMYQETQTL